MVMSKAVNFSDKANPKRFFSDGDTSLDFGLSSTVIANSYFKKNLIFDDDRGIAGERLHHTYVDTDNIKTVLKTRLNTGTHCTESQIDGGLCEPYLVVNWKASFEKMIIQRRYITIFDVISEIGGFWDLITYGILSIYFYCNTRSYTGFIRSQLVESLLELEKKRRGDQEIKQLRALLRDKSLIRSSSRSDLKNLSLQEVLNTKVHLHKIVDFHFKSKILIKIFFQESILKPIAAKMIYQRKHLELTDSLKVESKMSRTKPPQIEERIKWPQKNGQKQLHNRFVRFGGEEEISFNQKFMNKNSPKKSNQESLRDAERLFLKSKEEEKKIHKGRIKQDSILPQKKKGLRLEKGENRKLVQKGILKYPKRKRSTKKFRHKSKSRFGLRMFAPNIVNKRLSKSSKNELVKEDGAKNKASKL